MSLKVGDRVVYFSTLRKPLVGVITEITEYYDYVSKTTSKCLATVINGRETVRKLLRDLKPAVPATRQHLEEYDVWWYLNGNPVCVYPTDKGLIWTENFSTSEYLVCLTDNWEGPVPTAPGKS
jgi:hypothetical protein